MASQNISNSDIRLYKAGYTSYQARDVIKKLTENGVERRIEEANYYKYFKIKK